MSFGNWLIMALPISLAMLVLTWLLLIKVLYRPSSNLQVDRKVVNREYKELGQVSFEERVVLVVFIITALLWMFRTNVALGFIEIPGWSNLLPDSITLDDGTVAIVMALLMFFIPTRSEEARTKSATIVDVSVFRNLPWGVIILFGGGFALAKGFQVSGLVDYLGGQLTGLAAFSPVVMVTSINLTMTFLTELTSNTATTQMILPILASLAVAIGENPLLLMIPATLSASCVFVMPVATPPNAIVFGSEREEIAEMVKAGLFLNFIGVALVTSIFFLWGTVVFWELHQLLSHLYVKGEMTANPITVTPDDTIAHAVNLMLKNKVGGLPVGAEDGQLVGIITESDIFRLVVRELGE